jgi:hypothetical protein
VRPRQHGAPAEFFPVIRPKNARQPTLEREAVEDADNGQSPQRACRDDRHRFRRGVIDDGQALQHAPFRRPVEDEIRRPHLVRRLRPDQRLAIDYRHLLPSPTLHLEPRLRVGPIDALVIHGAPFLPELQIDHASPIAPMPMGQRDDAVAQARVGIGPRHVAQRRRAHAHDG